MVNCFSSIEESLAPENLLVPDPYFHLSNKNKYYTWISEIRGFGKFFVLMKIQFLVFLLFL